MRKIFIFLIIIFIGWISLFGEALQLRYKNITFLGLVLLLFVSFLYKKPEKFSIVDLAFFLYLLFVSLTLPFSENKAVALDWYERYILPVPFIYLIMRNIDKKDILFIAWSFFCFSSLIVLVGLLEAIFRKNIIYEFWVKNLYYQRFIYQQSRIISTLVHPTVFGSFLLGCLPFSFFLTSNTIMPYKIFIKIFISLIILGIIFSFSRGNIIGLLGLSLIFLLLTNRVRYIKFILIGLLILILLSSTLLKREFGFMRFSLKGLSLPWWTCEMEKSRITLKIFKKYPILGIGLNHYRLKFDQYSSDNYKRIEEQMKRTGKDPYEWRITDNMYLAILAETGLMGFLSFILFLFLLFKKGLSLLKIMKDSIEKDFLIACICGIIGLLLSMNTYDLLYWINPLLLFWFLIGTLKSIESYENRKFF